VEGEGFALWWYVGMKRKALTVFLPGRIDTVRAVAVLDTCVTQMIEHQRAKKRDVLSHWVRIAGFSPPGVSQAYASCKNFSNLRPAFLRLPRLQRLKLRRLTSVNILLSQYANSDANYCVSLESHQLIREFVDCGRLIPANTLYFVRCLIVWLWAVCGPTSSQSASHHLAFINKSKDWSLSQFDDSAIFPRSPVRSPVGFLTSGWSVFAWAIYRLPLISWCMIGASIILATKEIPI